MLGLLLASAALVVVAVVEPLVSQAGLASVDPGLVVLSGLLLGLALWARRSFWLLRNVSALTLPSTPQGAFFFGCWSLGESV